MNTPYAKRQRDSKRLEATKKKRREARSTPEQREKARLYAVRYRKNPKNRIKAKAREAAKLAMLSGVIIRPESCQICGCLDVKQRDGRSGLRMDHHKGYEIENYLNVIFICLSCDGKQLRKHE